MENTMLGTKLALSIIAERHNMHMKDGLAPRHSEYTHAPL